MLFFNFNLGWGDISLHGSTQIPTPNIDLLASSGILLTNYYVSPICSPSRSALLTGLNPIRTGMQVGVIAAPEPYGLPLNYPTMGQYFQKINYQTHVVGKWHQGYFQSEYLPTNRGFDTFFGYVNGHSNYYTRETFERNFTGYDFYEMESPGNLSRYNGIYATDMYTDRAVEIIQKNNNLSKPWLIYLAQISVHSGEYWDPIQPPNRHKNIYPYIHDEKRRLFAGMVAALDESIGKIFQTLNDTNQLDNTIIVFSSDNGGATGTKNGIHIDNSQGSNWPLRGSKYSLWEGGIRANAFLWSKQLKPRFSNQLMHITDILPTLYTAAGGNVHILGNIDGISQWEKLKNDNNESNDDYEIRQHLLHNIDHEKHFWAVRYYNFKLKNGTWDENYGNWYEAPGQLSEHPTNGICYNCTNVYRILKQHGFQPNPKKFQVNCNRKENPLIDCPINEMCLYDIKQDPCELTNLAPEYSELTRKIYNEIYQHYNRQYSKPVNQPVDPEADPKRHGGFWRPWKD